MDDEDTVSQLLTLLSMKTSKIVSKNAKKPRGFKNVIIFIIGLVNYELGAFRVCSNIAVFWIRNIFVFKKIFKTTYTY